MSQVDGHHNVAWLCQALEVCKRFHAERVVRNMVISIPHVEDKPELVRAWFRYLTGTRSTVGDARDERFPWLWLVGLS